MMIKHQFKNKILIGTAIFFMASYPIYTNLQYGVAYSQYDRHQEWLRGESMFYNPWQYRILCPLLSEGFYQIYTNTIDRIIPIENIFVNKKPDVVRYFIVFILFRFVLHLFIFWLCIRFYYHFVLNKWLIYFSLGFLSLLIGNAVNDSDFSFNNYVNIILYLITGIILVEKKSSWWIVPIMIIGAFNRETALLIPFIYWFTVAFEPGRFRFPKKNINLSLIVSLILFVIIFMSIRFYFGYQPSEVYMASVGWEMLKLNIISDKAFYTYFEIFGVTSILIIWCLYFFRESSNFFKQLFLIFIPIWYLAHLSLAVGWESRLF